MRILSFTYGEHCAGLTMFNNNRSVACYEEERFTRIKTSTDFRESIFREPIYSICEMHNKDQIDINKFDAYLFPKHYNQIVYDTVLKNIFNVYRNMNYAVDEEHIRNNSSYYDHHGSHCALAYYTSGFANKKCLVVSMDGMGDDYSAKYFLGENNKMKYIDGIDKSRISFGMYYVMLTEFLGFQRLKDEGKIVGMSSHGDLHDDLVRMFDDAIGPIDNIKTRKIVNNDGDIFLSLYQRYFNSNGSRFYKGTYNLNCLAKAGQYVFEKKICEVLNNLHDLYPEYDHLCLSGGVFANVKLNKVIGELSWVKDLYITPPMGDEGLTMGSCLLYSSLNNNQDVYRLDDVYLGNKFSDKEIVDTYTTDKYIDLVEHEIVDIDVVSKLLDSGYIVGLFQGRMEYGPRALGNRSILADATKSGTYKKLNDRLKRNDFMPFAPVVLAEYADDIFDIKKARHSAEFMTMLYDTKSEWHGKIPSAIHPVDKTARIQLVYENKNKLLYDILQSYHKRTNVPVLINTSFNVHEEPIVCWPENALNHLVNGIVDYLIIENRLFRLKK
jgi:carbamoyltransferase